MARAIALLSGGLDSTLAVLLLRRQDIDVTAITFLTHFGCDMRDSSSCSTDPSENAKRFGFEVKLSHLAEKFIEIVKNPEFGHGKNMNPCIDCRILMLREAGELMRMTGADFVATGEVVSQRPMSQMKNTLRMIEKQAGLKGYVLRPLSAKLLEPTVAEQEGLVDRERLGDFNGRSRKPQIALAREFGLTDYPAPAGGCLLTDPAYSHRLRELLEHNPSPSLKDFHLLRVGRHFRLSSGLKVVVGRNQQDNAKIEGLAEVGDCLLDVEGAGSPIALISADAGLDDMLTAASICARYSDAKHLPRVRVQIKRGGEISTLEVSPALNGMPDLLRIQKKQHSEISIS
jgi:tRNA U34 2-thiouridine synthase MnmA/TrmU